jgi:hypothetical protein
MLQGGPPDDEDIAAPYREATESFQDGGQGSSVQLVAQWVDLKENNPAWFSGIPALR